MIKFYECKTCGNILVLQEETGVIPVCCGKTVVEMVPQKDDGPKEKHVPVITVKDDEVCVKVGEVEHPMSEEHYIKWIVLETNMGKHKRILNPNDKPMACFKLASGEEPISAYIYCNIHSLWMNVYEK